MKSKTPRVIGEFFESKKLESLNQAGQGKQDETGNQSKECVGKRNNSGCAEDAIDTKNYCDPKRDVFRGGKFHFILLLLNNPTSSPIEI
jgi:hypothetical protein